LSKLYHPKVCLSSAKHRGHFAKAKNQASFARAWGWPMSDWRVNNNLRSTKISLLFLSV
jgi:hypothetical protein